MVTVRFAVESDILQIIELLNEVSDLHGEMRNDIFIDSPRHITEDRLKKFIHDDKHYVLVVGSGKIIHGVMLCKIREYVNDIKFKDCKVMSIEDTCINREFRSKHYGTVLLERAKEIACSQNCCRIETNVWEFNKPSFMWLSANGFLVQRKVLEYQLKKDN